MKVEMSSRSMNDQASLNEKWASEIRHTIEGHLPTEFVCLEPWRWSRERGWRKDEIYAVVRRETFAVNAQIVIPPIPGTQFKFTTLAVENLPALAGNSDTVYRFIHGHEALRQLAIELKLALAWFEKFDSPNRCLEYLQSDQTRNPGSVAYKYCSDYLKALPTETC
jgi:hypothetical protein